MSETTISNIKTLKREATKYKRALKKLTAYIIAFESSMDKVMQEPSSPERGKRIANLMNDLTLVNQAAMHFELGYSFTKIHNMSVVKHNLTTRQQE